MLNVVGSENEKLSLDCLREYDVPVPPSNEPLVDPPNDANGRKSFFNVNTYYKEHPKNTVSNGIFNTIWKITSFLYKHEHTNLVLNANSFKIRTFEIFLWRLPGL